MDKPIYSSVLTALLVLLFTYAAVSKLLAYESFRVQMLNQVLPRSMNMALYYLLPPTELLTAVLLCLPQTYRQGLYLSFILMSAFTGYVALVMLHAWDSVPCSCGGILGKLKWGPHLILNITFLAITLVSIYLERKERRAGDS